MQRDKVRSYSASKLKLWERCPAKFCAYHLCGYKDEEGSSPSLALGNLLHEFFEKFYPGCTVPASILRGTFELAEWQQNFRGAWWQACEDILISEDEFAMYEQRGLSALENFYAREKSRGFRPPLMVEKMCFVDYGEIKYSGKIDRIDREEDGTLTVTDYKISSWISDKQKALEDLQLSIYYLGCQQSLGETPAKLQFYYPALHGQIITTRRDEEALNALHQLTIEVEIAIRTNGADPHKYPTNPNEVNCRGCGFREECPEHKRPDLASLPSSEEMLIKAEEYAGLKKREKELKAERESLGKEIKAYMREHELKELGECKLTTKRNYDYDTAKLWDFIVSRADGYRFMKVDKTALKQELDCLSLQERQLLKSAEVERDPIDSLHIMKAKRK